jgi:hypothetical protein
MSDDKGLITWSDEESKAHAMEEFAESIDAYSGINKSRGSHYTSFTNVEDRRSVRPPFTRSDYHAFRPDEEIPTQQKRIIRMCMDAYDKVGIIRNVIDLMGDFGSQGINLIHEDKSVEKFYQHWFKRVDGKERSERFLNNIYRAGNVIMYRSNAQITPELKRYMKTLGSDIKIDLPAIEENVIPWRYNFFNPLTVDMKDGKMALFMGKKNFTITAKTFHDNFKSGDIPAHILDTLPPAAKKAIRRGDKVIPLDPDRLIIAYYKKDDWLQWAKPMIYAILDDIVMLEKMRLADMSALDGAISNIRLWTLGNLEHKILPNKAAINKLRDILTSNVGGGTMELVWGPELSFTESHSEVYKFLGSEKYSAVLNSIYAGLGVPPTLTGLAGQSGGFTNNFISLKTLVERLQYGRDLLVKFWQKEVELVRRAMGFRKPAYVHFDQMNLSDETAEKNLLLQLADRDIISHETLLERFSEIPGVEKIRLKREIKHRDRDDAPEKAGPFHNALRDHDLQKIALQQGVVTPEDVGVETTLDSKELVDRKFPKPQPAGPSGGPPEQKKNSENPDGGRPKFSNDKEPRKKRVDKPKSKPGLAELVVWTEEAFQAVSEVVNTAFLDVKNKKNLRQLTKSDVADLEKLKLDVFANLELLSPISTSTIHDVLVSGSQVPPDFKKMLDDQGVNLQNMNIEPYRKHAIGLYLEYLGY